MQIPTDSRRELFVAATETLSRQREALGITEEQIAADIEELHSQRRAARLADVNPGLRGSERNSLSMGMITRVEAIFEDGVLRPLGDVPLYEGQRVTLTIERHANELDHAVAKREKPALTPEELQELLKDDTSSWADLIIQERGEY